MMYFIIEHPTRGCLKEWDADPYSHGDGYTFRFQWSKPRNDPEAAHRFHTLRDAERILSLMPEALRHRCQILRSSDWMEVPAARRGVQK